MAVGKEEEIGYAMISFDHYRMLFFRSFIINFYAIRKLVKTHVTIAFYFIFRGYWVFRKCKWLNKAENIIIINIPMVFFLNTEPE